MINFLEFFEIAGGLKGVNLKKIDILKNGEQKFFPGKALKTIRNTNLQPGSLMEISGTDGLPDNIVIKRTRNNFQLQEFHDVF